MDIDGAWPGGTLEGESNCSPAFSVAMGLQRSGSRRESTLLAVGASASPIASHLHVGLRKCSLTMQNSRV